MFESPIEEIKSKLDIVEVIGSYIKLEKAGANYRAICPFHSEKRPSFFVSPARQIWHCFGSCAEGGDIFKFVMKIEGVEFGDALKILAQKAGVQLKPIKKELMTERQRLYDINELSAKFFEKQLENSANGKLARKYLLSRGIKPESIERWRLGWAPESWRGLSDFLLSKGYKESEIEKAGLALKKDNSFYDRFRARIIFPIFDLNSQIIGFGGRVFQKEKEVAKYINSPATLLYDKSKVLYGLDKAKIEIRKGDACLLVEGYVDAILAHQAGVRNTVAVSGTALTPYQLKILKRYSDNLILAFDMDVAGNSATKRGIDLAQLMGFNIRIIDLPKEKDPADVISQNPEKFKKLVEGSLSIMDFYFQNAFSRFDKNQIEGKKEISKILLPVINRIPNKIEQSFWIQKLSRDLDIKEESIVEELRKIKPNEPVYQDLDVPNEGSSFSNSKNRKPRKNLLEEDFISLILKSPKNIDLVNDDKIPFFSSRGQIILRKLMENPNFPLSQLPPDVRDYFNYLSLKSDIEEMEEKDILSEIKFCLKEIQLLDVKEKLGDLSSQIKKAEFENDSKKIEELKKEFNRLSKGIINL